MVGASQDPGASVDSNPRMIPGWRGAGVIVGCVMA